MLLSSIRLYDAVAFGYGSVGNEWFERGESIHLPPRYFKVFKTEKRIAAGVLHSRELGIAKPK